MGQHAVNYSRDTINRQFLSGEHKFVSRHGNGRDFDKTDFTTDGTWNEIDISDIVPMDTVAIAINISVQDGAADSYFQVRAYASGSGYESIIVRTQVANVFNDNSGVLAVDSNRKLEYLGKNLAFTNIDVSITGYWI